MTSPSTKRRQRALAAVDRLERARALRESGLSYRAIGERLGCTGQRIHQLLHPAVESRGETVRGYLARRKREIEEHRAAVMRSLAIEAAE